MNTTSSRTILPCGTWLLAASVLLGLFLPAASIGQAASGQVQVTQLQPGAPCQDTFITHTLDHVTTTLATDNPLFESNGAGLAINDLDDDGFLDIVLGNLDGPNAIFWNTGDLTFRKERLPHGNSRAVNIVDVDGDGWLDIVFTQRKLASPLLWLNQRNRGVVSFRLARPFEGTSGYSMAWADLDGDNDLDVVTAAYDIEQEKMEGVTNLQEGRGVIYFENKSGTFAPTRLTPLSQALALLLTDLNDDSRLDILVGNDFFHPDFLWVRADDSWEFAKLFTFTTQNTMSFDAGDLDNDGQPEIFAADMKPYPGESLSAWEPLMANMVHDPFHTDPQIMANVLQVRGADGEFIEEASVHGIDGTGWSWSSKFGDLNNDGFLDLYAVNGMRDPKVFAHLPEGELIEENQVFRNIGANEGGSRFAPAPEWGLNATTGGRSMSMADLDNDGDLDIVVNNFMSQAQIFENQLCGGHGVAVDLRWLGSGNTRGIGAHVTLHTNTGSYDRDVRSSSGYLSGDPARLHFGLPTESVPTHLEIRWPDGVQTFVENISDQSLVTVTR